MPYNSLYCNGSFKTLDQASRGSRFREPTVQFATKRPQGFLPSGNLDLDVGVGHGGNDIHVA